MSFLAGDFTEGDTILVKCGPDGLVFTAIAESEVVDTD